MLARIIHHAAGSDRTRPKFVRVFGPDWRSGTRVRADGSFAMRGLPDGRYRVVVNAYGKSAEQFDVETGAEEVTLEMK